MKISTPLSAIILFFSVFVGVIGSFGILLALPLIAEQLQLNAVEQGTIVSAYFLGNAIFTIPGGIIADKFGSKRIIAIGLVLWVILTALTGMVTGLAILLIIRCLLGVIEAPLTPATMKAVAERTSVDVRTTTNAFVSSAELFGAAIAPLIVGSMITRMGWNKATYLCAGFGLIMALVISYFLPRPLNADTSSQPKIKTAKEMGQLSSVDTEMRIVDVLRNTHIWKLTGIMFGLNIVNIGVFTWVPTFLSTEKGLDFTEVGIATSLPLLIGAIGSLVGGWLFDRYYRKKFRSIVIPSLLVSTIFLLLMVTASNVSEFVLFESIALFFLSLTTQPVIGLTMQVIPSNVLGIGSGVLLFGGKLANMVTPIAMGWIINRFSFQFGFGFLVLGAMLAVIISLWVREKPNEMNAEYLLSIENSPYGQR
ncbi:MFS transporter [Brevibacillus fluminis]|uniref:MFS transporter n=1 Tax=Brevibacillus fluminis TaxID=511487 RepID=A0A3M8D175_9BACL|nr:MFS transporter [Brevibacillus fluminis]RNB81311.1 MFS transporter [Brevibacillus fluminis]